MAPAHFDADQATLCRAPARGSGQHLLVPSPPLRRQTRVHRGLRHVRWLALLIVVFFTLGLGWGLLLEWWLSQPSPAAEARRATALRFIDEAARAARQERSRDAYLALARARHTDPRLPGLDVLLGEMLVNMGYASGVGPIAWEALNRGEHEARANLLIGLEWWGRRGTNAQTLFVAGNNAFRWLTLAHEGDPFDGSYLVIRGEVQRRHGRTEEGRYDLIAGLRRLQPWHSASVMEDKAQLAAAEAGRGMSLAYLGRFLPEPATVSGAAAVQLRDALRGSGDPRARLQALRRTTTERQLDFLLRDRSLRGHPQLP